MAPLNENFLSFKYCKKRPHPSPLYNIGLNCKRVKISITRFFVVVVRNMSIRKGKRGETTLKFEDLRNSSGILIS